MNFELIGRLAVVGIALVLLERAGFWIWFGAHPSWSMQGVVIGIGIGLGLVGLGLAQTKWRSTRPVVLFTLFVVLTLFMIACTKFGKMGFVNSYAENRLAGQFWYYGYIGQMGTLFATGVAALGLGIKRLSKTL